MEDHAGAGAFCRARLTIGGKKMCSAAAPKRMRRFKVAINNAIRLLASVLLVGLVASELGAQETLGLTSGGNTGAARSMTASPAATVSETPPKAPKVTCDGGQLRISADNSTLGSVLAAVHACIGVLIDIPAGAGGQRTFEELGPGPEREVLESLLSGTDFNYVIGSSDADPQKIETVLLMQRTNELATNAPSTDRTLTPARRAWMESRQNFKRAGTTGEEAPQVADEPAETPAASDDVAAAPEATENSNANATQTQTPATDAASPAADPPVPAAPQDNSLVAPAAAVSEMQPASSATNTALESGKTTAERITDMQQMFQQRRQMTQGQNSTTTQPQP